MVYVRRTVDWSSDGISSELLGHPQPTAMDLLQVSHRESARGNNDRSGGSGTGKQLNQHTASAFFSYSFVKADVIGRQIPTRHPGNVSVRSLAVPRIVFRTRHTRNFARPVAVKALQNCLYRRHVIGMHHPGQARPVWIGVNGDGRRLVESSVGKGCGRKGGTRGAPIQKKK